MGIKVQISADLHTEFWEEPFTLEHAGDILVLAGDIGVGTDGIDIVKKAALDMPVIYVAGNHEYYHQSIPDLDGELLRCCQNSSVHFLEKEEFVYSGIRFLGCTLWSDFALLGQENKGTAKDFARIAMNDYKAVKLGSEGRELSPEDTNAFFNESVAWLENKLTTVCNGPTVVVTHHAPSLRSLEQRDQYSLLLAAFASDLDEMILRHNDAIDLWIHGHTHYCVDYKIGHTRVVSNQYGYVRDPVPGYQNDLVVEL